MLTLNILLKKFPDVRVLGLKKASKFNFFKNVKTEIFIFEYFTKIPSKMNFNHPEGFFLQIV